jgi:hypothetical protein
VGLRSARCSVWVLPVLANDLFLMVIAAPAAEAGTLYVAVPS